MLEKELISLGAQLTRCYSENKKTPYRSHLALSSWGGTLKSRFENVLTNNHLSWKGVKFFEEDFVVAAEALDEIMRSTSGGTLAGAFAKDKNDALKIEENCAPTVGRSKPAPSIVYLTSDSPYTLEYLSPNTSYIIGGIVDKNRHKGLCYKRACEMGIPTAKLPIGEYMTMQSRTVLAVNHVAEIMLKWLVTGDWGEAFLSVIPKRKEAKLKVKRSEEDHGEENESDDEEGWASALENQAVNAGKETDERDE
ncbi:guanine-N1--methyltransferase [Hyaloscypha hepaticicola]|uniref:tRNA (guanine(9)-N1)-methyltransferase n=1 Tax=Hyaloscypha hepaticicola TaxID=2082293 RepID=A0A2J6PJ14_9HELO|nr:guanine-N1--methyltransferase [Hyaloscypha hepaticicola]